MKKEEIIAKYGEAGYENILARNRAYYKAHREEVLARTKKYKEDHKEEAKAAAKKWQEQHPEEVKANHHEASRKGGKRYDKQLEYDQTGIRGDRNKIRKKHRHEFREIKDTLAEEVELHHEWIGDTAEYRGVAFVDKEAHRNGFIDVLLLLDGEITSHGRIKGCEQCEN